MQVGHQLEHSMNFRSLAAAGSILAGTFALAGCNLGGTNAAQPYAKIGECWGADATNSVSEIVQPHLVKAFDSFLAQHKAPDSLAKRFTVKVSLSSRHPIAADPVVGKVECSGDLSATISAGPGYPSVTLDRYGVEYDVYPSKDGLLTETTPAALDDQLGANEDAIVAMGRAVLAGSPTAAKSAAPAASAASAAAGASAAK
jgi:hypothetical protein